jgi:RNA polymerase-interacting CarD/CdnL/TRCF family regulator
MRLELGESIRYQGLGAGQVIRHEERAFQGQLRIFAVIELPHRAMTVQLPIDDPEVARKLSRVLSKTECRRLVVSLREPGQTLARNWDQRAENGNAVLKRGGPVEWVGLLRAYASARKEGMPVAASDAEIVRTGLEMLAAELCAAAGSSYKDCFEEVQSHYRRAATENGREVKRNTDECDVSPVLLLA